MANQIWILILCSALFHYQLVSSLIVEHQLILLCHFLLYHLLCPPSYYPGSGDIVPDPSGGYIGPHTGVSSHVNDTILCLTASNIIISHLSKSNIILSITSDNIPHPTRGTNVLTKEGLKCSNNFFDKLMEAIASVNKKKEELLKIPPAHLDTLSAKAKLDQLNVSYIVTVLIILFVA